MKNKKTICITLVLLIVLYGVLSFSGCVGYRIYDLKEAYKKGVIDDVVLLNIAYYGGWVEENADKFYDGFTPKEKGELTEFTKKRIIVALNGKYNQGNYFYKNNIKDFEIKEYYGTYNGYIAFSYDNKGMMPIDDYDIKFGDFIFRFYDSERGQYIAICKIFGGII